MTAKDERALLDAVVRIEEHLKQINDVTRQCEPNREKIWKAIGTLRVTVAVIVAVPSVLTLGYGLLLLIKRLLA